MSHQFRPRFQEDIYNATTHVICSEVFALRVSLHTAARQLRDEFYSRRRELQEVEIEAFKASHPDKKLPTRTFAELQLIVRIRSGTLEITWKRLAYPFPGAAHQNWLPIRWSKATKGYSDTVLRAAARDWEGDLAIEIERQAKPIRHAWSAVCALNKACIRLRKHADVSSQPDSPRLPAEEPHQAPGGDGSVPSGPPFRLIPRKTPTTW